MVNSRTPTPVVDLNDFDAVYQSQYKPFHIIDDQYRTNRNHRVSLTDLVLMMTVVGLVLYAISELSDISALVVFLGGWVISALVGLISKDSDRIRVWGQFTWGLCLPMVLILTDSGMYARFEKGIPLEINRYAAVPTYFAFGICFFGLAWSWFQSPRSGALVNRILAGLMFSATLLAILHGIIFIPFLIVGSFSLVGLVALIPWMAGYVYLRTALMHWRWSQAVVFNAKKHLLATLFGFLLPLFVYLMLSSLNSFNLLDFLYEFWESLDERLR